MTNKRAPMVWGGWSGHEPRQCVERFAPALREAGFDVEIPDTRDAYLDAERLRSRSLKAHETTRRGLLWTSL